MASISRRQLSKALSSGLGIAALGGMTGKFSSLVLAIDKLNFQSVSLNDPEFIGYMIAIDYGYHATEGLGVNYTPDGPEVISEDSLLTGKSDISLTRRCFGPSEDWRSGTMKRC